MLLSLRRSRSRHSSWLADGQRLLIRSPCTRQLLAADDRDGLPIRRSIDPNALFAQYRRGPEHPDPVDAARLARRLGADYFVLGDIVGVPGEVNLGAALYDARAGAPALSRVAVQGASSALFDLVDSLAARILVGR